MEWGMRLIELRLIPSMRIIGWTQNLDRPHAETRRAHALRHFSRRELTPHGFTGYAPQMIDEGGFTMTQGDANHPRINSIAYRLPWPLNTGTRMTEK
jgi:hypothetical protein